MAIDQKKADDYVMSLQKKFTENPEKLELFERRLFSRYEEAIGKAQQADQDVRNLQQQIGQAQARIGSLEVQHAGSQEKAAAYIEALIARKFEDDIVDEVIKTAKPIKKRPTKKVRNKTKKSTPSQV